MATKTLIRLSGGALMLGGVLIALFFVTHPWNQLVGAHVAHTGQWALAHTFHFLGALCVVFGLIGLYARQARHTGTLGLSGFVLAAAGTIMFTGTGMITAFVWPAVAEAVPGFVDPHGQMFTGPIGAIFTITTVLCDLGFIVLGIATIRAGVLPRVPAALMVVGTVLYSVPPPPLGPGIWAIGVLGGVLFGIGAVWTGYVLSGRPLEGDAHHPRLAGAPA